MDSINIIGMVSVITAGLTTAIGSIGPSLGEGRAVSQALGSIAQQPDETNSITRTLFVGLAMIESTAIYCFVVSMILLFANPFWDYVVIAQIVNFLILVFLLKYFLYDRIVKAMDEREQKIQQRLQEAEEKKQEAEQEAEAYGKKNRDFDAKREEMLAQAKDEAGARRKELTEEARQAVTKQRSVWLEAIQRDKKSFVQDLRKMAGSQVYTIARKAFRDLSDEDVEQRTINAFLVHLNAMSKKTREAIAASIKESGNEVIVRSAFEIPAKMREKITGSLRRKIADGIEIRYEAAPELIMGMELKIRGHKIAWSLEDYLDTLEEHALQALETEAQRKPTGASAEQGKEPEQEQLPETKRARRKRANRKQSKETNETTTQ